MDSLSFRNRRSLSLFVTALAILLAGFTAWLESSRLANPAFFTGFTLSASILILVLLGIRRRLPVLPLGSVSTWTQVHLYVGIFSVAVYAMHVPSLVAGGVFESGLSMVFLVVTASGFYGIYASRTLPRRLTAVEGEHRFDRVAWHRHQIASKAKGLLEELNETAGVRVLEGFYERYLAAFFHGGPSIAYVIVPNGARRRRLLSGLKELDRYLEEDSRQMAGRFAALVRRRDDLDYQFALQLRLRIWLVVHCVFSIALVAGGLIHVILVWRYTG